jgi:glucokinase
MIGTMTDDMTVTAGSNAMHDSTRPRLLADIGGTHARFALETGTGQLEAIAVLPCNAYPSLQDAMRAYLSRAQVVEAGASRIKHAALAIANPVDGDEIRMTNHHWGFSTEGVRRAFGFDTLLVVNDFKALAMAVPYLASGETLKVGRGTPRVSGVIGVLGAGTGLGVSSLVPAGGQWIALEGEGGHVTFSPFDEVEMDVLRFAWREHPHVSGERLLSGIGIDLLYRALADRAGVHPEALSVPEILRRGLAQECAVCDQVIECFCAMLGTVAANLALTLGAKGGIYIGGGIVPRLGERFLQSGFRRRFEDKGRFAEYLAQIPTYVITAEYPAFSGLSGMLKTTLCPCV